MSSTSSVSLAKPSELLEVIAKVVRNGTGNENLNITVNTPSDEVRKIVTGLYPLFYSIYEHIRGNENQFRKDSELYQFLPKIAPGEEQWNIYIWYPSR